MVDHQLQKNKGLNPWIMTLKNFLNIHCECHDWKMTPFMPWKWSHALMSVWFNEAWKDMLQRSNYISCLFSHWKQRLTYADEPRNTTLKPQQRKVNALQSWVRDVGRFEILEGGGGSQCYQMKVRWWFEIWFKCFNFFVSRWTRPTDGLNFVNVHWGRISNPNNATQTHSIFIKL